MIIRSSRAIGAAIRDRRMTLGLDQNAVARMAGVTRQWLGAIEKGKDTAALGLVLRTLTVLGLNLDLRVDEANATHQQPAAVAEPAALDIDEIVTRSRRAGKSDG